MPGSEYDRPVGATYGGSFTRLSGQSETEYGTVDGVFKELALIILGGLDLTGGRKSDNRSIEGRVRTRPGLGSGLASTH